MYAQPCFAPHSSDAVVAASDPSCPALTVNMAAESLEPFDEVDWLDDDGLHEHHTIWPPSERPHEPASPRFPPRAAGERRRARTAAAVSGLDDAALIGAPMLPVFEPQEARARLLELGVGEDDGGDLCVSDAAPPRGIESLGTEEARRAKLLRRLADDAHGGRRAALIGDGTRLTSVRQLVREAPNFETALLPIANALALSAVTRRPASIPPLLLLGPPGIGKTHVAKRLAAAIGAPYRLVSMNLSPAFGQIGGLDIAWRGARIGKVAQALVETGSASPLLILNEVDKPLVVNARDTPWDALHSLWEPENAASFRDEYLDLQLDARGLISIATANDVDAMPASLLDRLLVIDVKPPSTEQRRVIAERLYAMQCAAAADVLAPALEPDALDALATLTPRRIARTLALAIAHAVAEGRTHLAADDVLAAASLVDGRSAKQPAKRFGFVLRG